MHNSSYVTQLQCSIIIVKHPSYKTAATSYLIVVVIYRPGSASVSTSFFDDLSDTLDHVVGYNEPIFIVGDLNVRLDRSADRASQKLISLFDSYGFVNHVFESTHVAGEYLTL